METTMLIVVYIVAGVIILLALALLFAAIFPAELTERRQPTPTESLARNWAKDRSCRRRNLKLARATE
jgi:hypothetical protein